MVNMQVVAIIVTFTYKHILGIVIHKYTSVHKGIYPRPANIYIILIMGLNAQKIYYKIIYLKNNFDKFYGKRRTRSS